MDKGMVNMAIRTICLDTEDILRKKSREVTEFNQKLWNLLDDMAETMYKSEGVGLAAVQVGILKRVVLVDIGDKLYEMINPEIISVEGEQEGLEGCLSSPTEYGKVKRPMSVTVKAFDRNGQEYKLEGKELAARAICHEVDHLNGILFKDLATEIMNIEENKKRVNVKRKK